MSAPRFRALLVAVVVFGLLGTAAELLLLEHTEDLAQKVPLVAIAVALGACGWFAWRPIPASTWALRVVMLGLLVVAACGLYFHITGNLEFELELHPSARGWDLIRDSLGGATPTLAPGALALLGLTGLLASSAPTESD